jgi:hypothetical protein
MQIVPAIGDHTQIRSYLKYKTCGVDDLLLRWVALQRCITADVIGLAEFEMTNRKELV